MYIKYSWYTYIFIYVNTYIAFSLFKKIRVIISERKIEIKIYKQIDCRRKLRNLQFSGKKIKMSLESCSKGDT